MKLDRYKLVSLRNILSFFLPSKTKNNSYIGWLVWNASKANNLEISLWNFEQPLSKSRVRHCSSKTLLSQRVDMNISKDFLKPWFTVSLVHCMSHLCKKRVGLLTTPTFHSNHHLWPHQLIFTRSNSPDHHQVHCQYQL